MRHSRTISFRDELKLLFKCSRLGRIRYLSFVLFIGLLFSFAVFLMVLLGVMLVQGELHYLYPSIFLALILCLFLSWIFVFGYRIFLNIRRLHDINLRGWWVLISLIPLLRWFLLIILYSVPGSQKKNRFGVAPSSNNRWTYFILGMSILGLLIIWLTVTVMFFHYLRPEIVHHSIYLQHQLHEQPTWVYRKYVNYLSLSRILL